MPTICLSRRGERFAEIAAIKTDAKDFHRD